MNESKSSVAEERRESGRRARENKGEERRETKRRQRERVRSDKKARTTEGG